MIEPFKTTTKLRKSHYIYIYIWCRVAGPWDPPPREGGRVTTPRPPLWYCGTSRVSWQSSRQQNMFQINNKYTTPAPPCGTVVLLKSVVASKSTAEHVPNKQQIHYPRPPLWYCGTSRVSWQASRQQNMFQINKETVVLFYF